jgi:hypothetical protein
MHRPMRFLGGFLCWVALSQTAELPAKWQGRWVLDLQESKIGEIWAPGLPAGIKLLGQTVKITTNGGQMKLSDDTILSQLGSIHGENDLDMSRLETAMPGGAKRSFKQIDDNAFDIVLSVNDPKLGNHVGENHFVFSADGKTLAETKTHIERELAPEGADPAKSVVIKTSTSVLVFHRTLSAP